MSSVVPPAGRAVTFRVDHGIGYIVIDNPPVNASSAAVRKGLIDALRKLRDVAGLQGVVLAGSGASFVAGSDVTEFDGEIPPPLLPEVIDEIERFYLPVVAAIDGYALGGGLELALGCDARVATPTSTLGLPEVTLGLVPGAGGTQRLPRLIGAVAAAELIVTGRRIHGEEALRLGLVDRLRGQSDLMHEAADLVRGLGAKRTVIDIELDAAEGAALRSWGLELSSRRKGRPAVMLSLGLVELACSGSGREALLIERATFDRLRGGDEAAAHRYLFFAERAAATLTGHGEPTRIQRVGVIGAGTMGVGIAAVFACKGMETVLVEINPSARKRARANASPGVRVEGDLEALAGSDLVIEAIVEDLDVKESLLMQLSTVVPPPALIASNTSYLDINALAESCKGPERFLGMHFFNPPGRMKLLEVVRGDRTEDDALATATQVGKRIGKTPVLANVGEGFIGNRMYAAYRKQCEFLLEEGAYPEQVDRVLVEAGFQMGPFAVGDLSGLDIAWSMRKRLAATRDPNERYVEIPDQLCQRGWFGVKVGRGYYQYGKSPKDRSPDPEVARIIEECSERAGVRRREIGADEIRIRAFVAWVNEAALLLEEGVANRSSDVDVVATLGFGFPRHLGGPLWWALHLPKGELEQGLDLVRENSGRNFRCGPIKKYLQELQKRTSQR